MKDVEDAQPSQRQIPLIHHPAQTAPEPYKIVSVRLREAEFEAFTEQASEFGLTNNMALRVAARRIGGFVEIDMGTREVLEGILKSISEISRNIARMHATSMQSGAVDTAEFTKLRAEFGYEFARLDATLMSILNIAERRLDGRLRLQEAAK
ncbi:MULTISPECIES: DNA mobilization endonuclease VirD1/MobC family subunit [Agrobacterium]|uniref:Type IV secretion system T-DNA border endonuclease VirD1 n=1 Tax=Agrobacterium tumefaciens TaxID=358 RepID=A0AAW8M1L0_AGRTU|nr:MULTISPECIES: DNA mobilization endonuclease VirD1/MobC family subunit [Agrobacterium]MBP2568515.1 type IV secretion system T-DNA border endonuclease VirD1 [Agrobacterium tumefaciens]MDR6705349.1 type IV secretion system T-DNA border endonuclease VirD1 [Agrobacterium tumefaciens]TCV46350.1 type IV secretion system T-DNA border endonuclease VirD1 [Agrobacterium tumefaciens]